MLSDGRRTRLGLGIAGVAAGILLLPSMYVLGLWLAPPRPVPSDAQVPALLADAIWASADGGRAAALQAINPVNLVDYGVCRILESRAEDPQRQADRRGECLRILPALPATAYLAGVHLRDSQVASTPAWAIQQWATAAWLTRSWTKAELVATLAERAEFGFGWRGVDAGARGYFGTIATTLSVPDAALLAALIGNGHIDRWRDPWCDPATATTTRGRVLERMRENLAIDEPAYRRALAAPIELAPAPPEHRPCTQRTSKQ